MLVNVVSEDRYNVDDCSVGHLAMWHESFFQDLLSSSTKALRLMTMTNGDWWWITLQSHNSNI